MPGKKTMHHFSQRKDKDKIYKSGVQRQPPKKDERKRIERKNKITESNSRASHGTLKLWLGKNPILLRGREKVQTEIRLASFAYNLVRIFNLDGFDNLIAKINNYNWKLA